MIIFCVNDGAVMEAWAKDQEVDDSKLVTLMGDPTGEVTSALGMELSHPGPEGKGLVGRCKRFAAYLVNGVVTASGAAAWWCCRDDERRRPRRPHRAAATGLTRTAAAARRR